MCSPSFRIARNSRAVVSTISSLRANASLISSAIRNNLSNSPRKPSTTVSALALVNGIKYQRLGDEYYYAQELFDQEELTGYLKNMTSDTTKSVYEQVVYDSNIEQSFADEMENSTEVKVYAKLPRWFTVPTPTWKL